MFLRADVRWIRGTATAIRAIGAPLMKDNSAEKRAKLSIEI